MLSARCSGFPYLQCSAMLKFCVFCIVLQVLHPGMWAGVISFLLQVCWQCAGVPGALLCEGSCNSRRRGHSCCFSAGRGPPISGQEPLSQTQLHEACFFGGLLWEVCVPVHWRHVYIDTLI